MGGVRVTVLLFAVCGLFPSLLTAGTVAVTVSVAPQAHMVKAIGGDRVSVDAMVRSGQSAHTFSPSPRQMMALSDARIYVKVGHPEYVFERRYLERLAELDHEVRVVNMAHGTDLRTLEEHAHGDGRGRHQHEGGETDPHLWVSPRIMRATADRIAEALIAEDPAGEADYRAGLSRFHRQLDELDSELRETLDGLQRRMFLVNHPAWGYFADEYGLQQRAIESEGKDASPAQLAALIERTRADDVKAIFVQTGFSKRGALLIARELDISVISLDPMAEDWPGTLRSFARALREFNG